MGHRKKCPDCLCTTDSPGSFCSVCGAHFEPRELPSLAGTAVYIGGHPRLQIEQCRGAFCASSRWIGLAGADGGPREGASLQLAELSSVEVDDGQIIRSRLGAVAAGALVAGIIGAAIGAAAAKGTESQASVVLHTKDGHSAYFALVGKSRGEVRAAIAPSLAGADIPFHEQFLAQARSAPMVSVADELQKLAVLRDSGVLTEEEFAGQKARLLSP